MYVNRVGKLLSHADFLKYMKVLTLRRNLIYRSNVAKLSPGTVNVKFVKAHTLY